MVRLPRVSLRGAPGVLGNEEYPTSEHWLAKRRRKLAKMMNNKEAKAKRYVSIILGFAKEEEDLEFARAAYVCLGKALGFVPNIKKAAQEQ